MPSNALAEGLGTVTGAGREGGVGRSEGRSQLEAAAVELAGVNGLP